MGVVAVLAALSLLSLGAFVGAVLLLGGGDDDTVRAPLVQNSGGASPDASADATPESGGADKVTQVRCWNDVQAEAQAACPPVRGPAGMQWLFPSLAAEFSGCDAATPYGGKLRAFGCTMSVPGGPTARVVYSEWRSFELGDTHYREKYGAPDRTDAQFNVWSTVPRSSNYQTSRMFVSGLPFSVTVASRTARDATAIMNQLRFRRAPQTDPYL